MSYEINHKDWMCDKCQKKQKIWVVPFLYHDYNDHVHPDLGNKYRQYYICDECQKAEAQKLKSQGKGHWNKYWIKIN